MLEREIDRTNDAIARIFEMTGKLPSDLVQNYNPPPEEVRLSVLKDEKPEQTGLTSTVK